MGTTRIWFLCALLVVVVCCSHTSAEDEGWRLTEEGDAAREEGGGSSTGKWFVLQNSKHVVKTDAGDMRVVGGFRGKFMRSPMHVGFITMEPRSLFIPQYLDSSLILFIRQGEARVGHIYKDELVERSLKMGDIYRIEAGSVFYLINRAEEEKLHVICSIDASESLGWHTIQGSMMAPHINPRATEYGIVLRGSGTIQIVYPNGTLAMNAEVTEGDVFWIPRYFPFCQIASKSGPFEFFGFTTSARNNRPQFLVGANSLLHVMRGPEFGAGFGLSEDGLSEIIDAQRESVILPAAADGGPIGNVIDSLA